jgi:ubiquinone/menaquinone biosynthesis C-methylase UbiE
MRCSLILGLAGFSGLDVFDDLRKAYDKLNKILHGQEKVKLENDFIERIQAYARKGVQCVYILCLTRWK